jgi:Acetyl-CoA hydrolase/transferase C-terminal domain
VGIGGIPNAVLSELRHHRHLGVHAELLSDGIVDLVERGVVTGTRRTLRPNKIVTTFALGTQRRYDWLHENSAVEVLPVDYVNDPRTVARERNLVSISATTEVDLYGQCASETIAGRYRSSSGSRIRLHLSEGSVVTTLKNTVDHVATEWGVAKLRGRSLADRARALIAKPGGPAPAGRRVGTTYALRKSLRRLQRRPMASASTPSRPAAWPHPAPASVPTPNEPRAQRGSGGLDPAHPDAPPRRPRRDRPRRPPPLQRSVELHHRRPDRGRRRHAAVLSTSTSRC